MQFPKPISHKQSQKNSDIISSISSLEPGLELAVDINDFRELFFSDFNPEKGETPQSEMQKFLERLKADNIQYIEKPEGYYFRRVPKKIVYTHHIAGELGKDLIQRCIVCGEIISDYRNVMYRIEDGPPRGFPRGEIFISNGNPRITMVAAPYPEYEIVNCR